MDRRTFVAALGAGLLTVRPAAAQTPARKAVRLGWVGAWCVATGDPDEAGPRRRGERLDAVVALSIFLIMGQRTAIAEFAVKHKIPTISSGQDFALAGNLMSYGPNLDHAWWRLATYVDKILRGARPGDLPVEQLTKFQLVINLKAAQALRLTIPPELLVLADRTTE